MERLNIYQNNLTQPLKKYKVFNNWNIVTKGWYIACRVKDLKKQSVQSFNVCGQKIVLYRGESGKVYALDGFCPHMGVDLGIGKVLGEDLRCFFHHHKFNGNGQCIHIPCQEEIPSREKLQSYAVREKYGFIWVYPDSAAATEVLEIPSLEGQETVHLMGKSYFRRCHYHVTMINGIDPQHLKTVHDINIEMDLEIKEDERHCIDIELGGEMPSSNFKERLSRKILGDRYAYSMKYADGCLAALTAMKNVSLFGRFKLPELNMFFAYQALDEGKTLVQPFYVTKKRSGIFGKLISWFLLQLTRQMFFVLQGEDGEVYENIRFKGDALLPIDEPVARYIGYINRLEPSLWSKHPNS